MMQMFSGLRRFSALIVPEGKAISADIPISLLRLISSATFSPTHFHQKGIKPRH